MLKITKQSVNLTMGLLIHTNGSTTTLEVKNHLRTLGYMANQAEVKEMMETLFDETNAIREIYSKQNNGRYNIYTFTSEVTDAYKNACDQDDEDDTTSNLSNYNMNDTEDDQEDTDSDVSADTNSNLSKYNMNTIDREPSRIMYTESQVLSSGDIKNNEWVVFHANGNNEIHIYNPNLSRDQVRSKYASLNNMKIQDVRARRYSNF